MTEHPQKPMFEQLEAHLETSGALLAELDELEELFANEDIPVPSELSELIDRLAEIDVDSHHVPGDALFVGIRA